MNSARRARQKANKTHPPHVKTEDPDHPGRMISVRCKVCRPLPMTAEERLDHAEASEETKIQLVQRTDYIASASLRMMQKMRRQSAS